MWSLSHLSRMFLFLCATARAATAAEPAGGGAGVDFFERRIRPMLVAECQECHSSAKRKGSLALDHRRGWRKGGDSGPAIIPGDPARSLLIQAISHTHLELKMPQKAPKLSAAKIADFVEWVRMGAPDPRDEADATAASGRSDWPALLAARRDWWSLQPLRKPALPAVRNRDWSDHPVDRFLLAGLEKHRLEPARAADPRTLLRRLNFVLIGLPPEPGEIEDFVGAFQRETASAIEQAADRLLASPHFGERWARHWMDLVRYAETHGSEGDPDIPHAWQYRDYLTRAFNADVGLDQLIREHIAGDLLPEPRLNAADGLNESIIGPAFFRLVEHGFQPVDSLEEQVRTVENQIDVFGKAFQGLTLACARCHDHKFDAISQRDYYALHGIFASARPGQVTIDTPDLLKRHRDELKRLKGEIKLELAEAWMAAAEKVSERLRSSSANENGPAARRDALEAARKEPWKLALEDAAENRENPLHAWARLRDKDGEAFASGWRELSGALNRELETRRSFNRERFRPLWDLAGGDYQKWFKHGAGLPDTPSPNGEFFIETDGDAVLTGLLPAGVYTHRFSERHNGVLVSPRFRLDSALSVRMMANKGGAVRLIVDNYPLGNNDTYPRARPESTALAWQRLDTTYRKGSWAYLEFTTVEDSTRPERGKNAKNDGRSSFGVAEVVLHDHREAPKAKAIPAALLYRGEPPQSVAKLAERYQELVIEAVDAWRANTLDREQVAFLDDLVRRRLLPAHLPELESCRPLVARYRELESDVPVPRRAPGVIEAAGHDAPFLVRGDHAQPSDPVPRRYLEVLGSSRCDAPGSGRLELARAITSPDNPLTSRVMVNRVWQHVFGQGLVPTVDNFGRLGELPSHPELLDYLAVRFQEMNGSPKKMLRFLVTTRAFQMSSEASEPALKMDPSNAWLQHMAVRRLDAEAIRDSMLAVSGAFNPQLHGPPVRSSPLDHGRRSIYLPVRRSAAHPFLEVFDAPRPTTTRGRRDVTTLPAQSLTLLNDPFVTTLAANWAGELVKDQSPTVEARIERMFVRALGRPPLPDELLVAREYLDQTAAAKGSADEPLRSLPSPWAALAQSLFNLKEFIYLR